MARTKSRRPARRQSNAGQDDAEARKATTKQPPRVTARLSRLPALGILVVVLATFIAFGGAIAGPFQFDDTASIPNNPTIERLWPPSVPLSPPPRAAVSGRPVANYSLAINHAINDALGIEQAAGSKNSHAAAGYRIANILIH